MGQIEAPGTFWTKLPAAPGQTEAGGGGEGTKIAQSLDCGSLDRSGYKFPLCQLLAVTLALFLPKPQFPRL